MYPQPELTRLATHKAVLRERIGRRRVVWAAGLADAMRPLAWLDRAVALWRKITPYAKLATIPLTLITKRVLFPRARILGTLLRWGPAVFGAIRSLNRR